jgi:hypothetical protein
MTAACRLPASSRPCRWVHRLSALGCEGDRRTVNFTHPRADFTPHRADFIRHRVDFTRATPHFIRQPADLIRSLADFTRATPHYTHQRADFTRQRASCTRAPRHFTRGQADFTLLLVDWRPKRVCIAFWSLFRRCGEWERRHNLVFAFQ